MEDFKWAGEKTVLELICSQQNKEQKIKNCIRGGVRQGCVLSHILLILNIRWKKFNKELKASVVGDYNNFLYANKEVSVRDTEADLQQTIDSMCQISKKYNMDWR